jgi:hypothetical protein
MKYSLQSIAQQCPFSGGRSVYVARTILHEYYTDMIYNDEDICSAEGLMRKKNENKQVLSNKLLISPNPANEIVNILYFNDKNPIVKTILYSMEGEILLIQNNSLPLNIKDLSPGLYLVNTLVKDGSVFTDKLIIIK